MWPITYYPYPFPALLQKFVELSAPGSRISWQCYLECVYFHLLCWTLLIWNSGPYILEIFLKLLHWSFLSCFFLLHFSGMPVALLLNLLNSPLRKKNVCVYIYILFLFSKSFFLLSYFLREFPILYWVFYFFLLCFQKLFSQNILLKNSIYSSFLWFHYFPHFPLRKLKTGRSGGAEGLYWKHLFPLSNLFFWLLLASVYFSF